MKVYARNDEELVGLLKTVKISSVGICIESRNNAKATLKRGKFIRRDNAILYVDTGFRNLNQEWTCTYLGLNEAGGIDIRRCKKKQEVLFRRMRVTMRAVLNQNKCNSGY